MARDLLGRTELFKGLPETSLAQLATVVSEAEFVEGQVLFRRGDPGDALHIIVGGVVQVSVGEDDEDTVIAVFGPGECVGELSLIDGRPRSATVEALEEVHTVVVPRDAFLEVIRSNVPTMEALLVTVVERLRHIDALAPDLAQLRASS